MAKQPPTDLVAALSCLYVDLKDRILELKTTNVLKQVGRYNNQIETEKKNYSTILPACWIELLPVEWDYNNIKVPKALVTFRLHICMQTHKRNFEYQDWELNQKVHEKVQNFETEICTGFRLVRTVPNHNYGVWIDNMVEYSTFVTDESLLRLRETGTITDITLSIDGDPDIPD